MSDPLAVAKRFVDAANRHDLEALVACMSPDFDSVQPVHPDRAFRGNAQVRTNWTTIFRTTPDFSLRILRSAVEGDTVWLELASGGRTPFGGIFILGIADDRVQWARVYTEPVEQNGAGIDASINAAYDR